MLDKKLFKEIKRIEIPKYLYQVQTSKSRLTKYFHKDSGRGKTKKELNEIPKKYKAVGYDLMGYAITAQGERIISNPIAAGTSKYVPINSQILYSSSGQFTRAKIMRELHSWWKEILKNEQPFEEKDYPLYIHIDWYCPKSHSTQDIDNFTYIMEKSLFDSMQEINMIPDDTVDYISGQSSRFNEIDHFDNRKLVIYFYICNNKNQLKLNI